MIDNCNLFELVEMLFCNSIDTINSLINSLHSYKAAGHPHIIWSCVGSCVGWEHGGHYAYLWANYLQLQLT